MKLLISCAEKEAAYGITRKHCPPKNQPLIPDGGGPEPLIETMLVCAGL